MNHRDLLDSVISGMTENTTTAQEPEDDNANGIDIDIDNSIALDVSTGDRYFVDPKTFDWDNAVDNLGQMTENEVAFRNIMNGIMMASHNDSDKAKEYLENTIKKLEVYLEGYQICVDYRKFNPDLTDVEVAMLMAFDANNVTRTMVHHTSMYSLMSTMSYLSEKQGMSLDGLVDSFDDGIDVGSAYRVCVAYGEEDKEATIISVEEIDDYSPDSVGVVDDDGQDRYSVIIGASNEEEAREIALRMFNESDEDELLTNELCEHEKYDADDEFDNSDDDAVIEDAVKETNDETC